MTFRKIGETIAREIGRRMPYTALAVHRALSEYRSGIRDEDGEKNQ